MGEIWVRIPVGCTGGWHQPVVSKPVLKMASSVTCSNEELLSLLECPVCYDVMRPPIMHCLNSHDVCSSCMMKLDNCPVCKAEFLPGRDVLAEHLSTKVKHPCENRDRGCGVHLRLNALHEHEIDCPQRLHECKFRLASYGTPRCEWKGRHGEIFDHVNRNHASNAEKHFITKLNGVAKMFCKLVNRYDELFWVISELKLKSNYCFAVQYIGSRSRAKKFMYEVKCVSKSGGELTFKSFCHDETQDTDALLREGPCFRVETYTLEHFLCGEGALPKLSIYRA
uniref:E3 ubiquitin-protein ligase n=1 Tax=Timema douglasi TaxID=61478 RepID=A0A7R8ZFA1_TIMDO|nr:unnamed protein product [Timema douglasi]